jgi:protein O-mannosyl-transferase
MPDEITNPIGANRCSSVPAFFFARCALAPAFGAFALSIVLYAVTLAGGFVYDDQTLCRDDPRLTEPGGWIRYLREPYFRSAPDPLWRPIPCLSYLAHRQLHGTLAWPMHAVNIVLHAVVSAMTAVLAFRLTGRIAVAWLAGLLFAAHPVHVEAVAYLVGRAESLCAIGVIGGLLIYLGKPLTLFRVAGIGGWACSPRSTASCWRPCWG